MPSYVMVEPIGPCEKIVLSAFALGQSSKKSVKEYLEPGNFKRHHKTESNKKIRIKSSKRVLA